MDSVNPSSVTLAVHNLCKSYQGLTAVDNVSLTLRAHEIHALIGANGAGKTTLLKLLCGLQMSDSGKIILGGHDITYASVHKRAALGLGYSAQIPELFEGLSVYDNLFSAAEIRLRDKGAPIDSPVQEMVQEMLQSLPFADDKDKTAAELNHAHRKLLQMAMVLVRQPAVLILDEPTQALASAEIDLCKKLMRRYAKHGTILLVEHNMDVVMDVADKITVLNFGQILASGAPQTIRRSLKVRQAYLGDARVGN